jgi:hypothetical protein
MAEARVKNQWDHTSQLLALLANGLCRGKGQAAFTAEQFHPYRQKKGPDMRLDKKQTMKLLRQMYGDKDYGG